MESLEELNRQLAKAKDDLILVQRFRDAVLTFNARNKVKELEQKIAEMNMDPEARAAAVALREAAAAAREAARADAARRAALADAADPAFRAVFVDTPKKSGSPSTDTTCGICLRDLSEKPEGYTSEEAQVVVLQTEGGTDKNPVKCGHKFHRGCIERWFELNRKCPLDNQPVTYYYPLDTSPVPQYSRPKVSGRRKSRKTRGTRKVRKTRKSHSRK